MLNMRDRSFETSEEKWLNWIKFCLSTRAQICWDADTHPKLRSVFTFTCNKFYCLSHDGDKWNEILTTRKSSSGRAHWWRNSRDNKAKHGSSLIGIRLQRLERSKHIIIYFGWIYQMRSIACLWPQTMASIRIHTHLYKCDGIIKPELAMKRSKWTVINANVNISTRKNNGFARWYEFKPQIIVTFAL